ncbi:MAG: two-component regulator propeller domain-containing protein [Cyclobacteriaceae bacterium]
MPQGLFAILLAIFLPLLSFGQKNIEEPIPASGMVMKQWTGADGLISNNLTSVNQTKDGFLWITTFNGIHRFDGSNFKLFDKENIDFLTTNAFYSVADDGEGVIFASQGGGLLRYEAGEISPMTEFEVSSVRKVIVDSKGRYWCGTQNEGVFLKDSGGTRKVNYLPFDQVIIMDIHEDKKGRIWFATEGSGLIILENGEYRLVGAKNLMEASAITSILETGRGDVVIGSTSGLFVMDEAGNVATEIEALSEVYINDLIEDSTGMIWIAAETGLYRIQTEIGYFEHFDATNGLPSNQLSSVIMDHEGSIWLSTKKSGLLRLNNGSIRMLGSNEGITSTKINIVSENEGKIYVGSDDGSIFIRENNVIRTLDLSTKSRQIGIRDFMFDGDVLWVASYLGLHRYSDGIEKILDTEDGLSSNLVRRVLKTRDGSVWLASRTGGVMRLENDEVTNVYSTSNGLKSNFILALEEDREGNVVAGTHSGGISIINKDTVETYLPDIGGAVIFNIHIAADNRYWISTSVGLFLFEDGKFKKPEFDVTFKIEAIFDFVPDNAGNIWLPVNTGIVRIDQNQLEAFLEDPDIRIQGTLYDNNDGMSIKECTGATRSTLLSDGSVMVPTLDGVAIINPSNIQSNKSLPKITITSFIVDKQPIPFRQREVEPGKLRYEFEFASSSYLAAEHVRFRYRLSGLDSDWILTPERKIEYTNLPPGDYTFSVIGSNNDGLWNEVGDSRSFVVKPFYYQTFLFKVLIGLIVILVFYFIFIWRVSRVQAINEELSKVNKELDRFVYSASHDIRAPLTSILGAVAIAKSTTVLEEKDHYLEMIETSADKLDGFIRDIIDYSRNQRLDIVKEEIEVKAEFESILDSLKYLDEEGNIQCTLKTEVSNFVTDVRRLRVILKNIISNAFFYTDPQKTEHFVTIDCRKSVSGLIITIKDNGLGMKKEVLKNIFDMFFRANTDSRGSGLGLYIARENVEKLGGTINVESELNVGTTFTIEIPELDA